MQTKFAWDEDKALRNLRKHGVSFQAAIEVFSDPYQVVAENYFVDGEQRYQVIGMTGKMVLVLVVFVDRNDDGYEVIHVVSARKGETDEEQVYGDQIR